MCDLTCCEVIERIKDILATDGMKNPKDIDIAKALDVSPNALAQSKFANRIPYVAVMNFLHAHGISINYFFFGVRVESLVESTNKYKILKLYTANASLGGGANNDEIRAKEIVLDNTILDYFGAKNCDIVVGVGDSMEGAISDGGMCIVDRDGLNVKNNKIYAVNTLDGLFIKRCKKDNEYLILDSLNSVYMPIKYNFNDVSIVGRVVGVINKL